MFQFIVWNICKLISLSLLFCNQIGKQNDGFVLRLCESKLTMRESTLVGKHAWGHDCLPACSLSLSSASVELPPIIISNHLFLTLVTGGSIDCMGVYLNHR